MYISTMWGVGRERDVGKAEKEMNRVVALPLIQSKKEKFLHILHHRTPEKEGLKEVCYGPWVHTQTIELKTFLFKFILSMVMGSCY